MNKDNASMFFWGLVFGAALLLVMNTYVIKQHKVVATLPDGGEYSGTMHDNKLHGYGKIEWPDNSYYEGEFVEGMMTGFGLYHYQDGTEYRGTLANGLMAGSGVLTRDTETYTGQFENDTFHGYGVYKLASGATYKGGFEHGAFHGFGEYVDSELGTYSGRFVEGALTGEGSYKSPEGLQYVGGFVDWVYNGQGILTKANGDQYIGHFENGSLTGDGKYIGLDDEHYQGEFKYNSYSGKGRLQKASGDVYKGAFRYGLYHGKGVLRYAEQVDGLTVLSGVWEDGELVEPDESIPLKTNKELVETILYNQHDLLDAAFNTMVASDNNSINLYFLGIAGYGSEAVFRREVLFVKDYFDEHYNTKGRSMALVNDRSKVEVYPLATKTSINRSFKAMTQKMDPNKDVLFVYLSSHGSKTFDFSLSQPGLALDNLPAVDLASAIRDLPVKWKVIVVSACYSGGYIKHLSSDDTLVITASAADKKSFGCSDENEFTYFGEAYFKDALPTSVSFVEAFEKAKAIVKQREKERGYTFSDPQISKPEVVVDYLKTWRRQLGN